MSVDAAMLKAPNCVRADSEDREETVGATEKAFAPTMSRAVLKTEDPNFIALIFWGRRRSIHLS
jgi:hypothetical protein